MEIDKKIEGLLFAKAEPIKIEQLVKWLEVTTEEVLSGIQILDEKLKERGIRLIHKADEVTLATAPELSQLIEKIRKEELTKDIGRAGLETLSIVLYKGPVSRREVDYIRGVNSGFILRHLTERGLVEKVTNPKDERIFLYKPTIELLAYLGISRIEELPEFLETKKEIEKLETLETNIVTSSNNVPNEDIIKNKELLE
jgi:segregation and condensation protein B